MPYGRAGGCTYAYVCTKVLSRIRVRLAPGWIGGRSIVDGDGNPRHDENQAAQARLLEEEWPATQGLLRRVLAVWRAAADATAGTKDEDHDGGEGEGAAVVELDDGERAALRRVASAGLQLMANLTAGFPLGAGRVFEVGG